MDSKPKRSKRKRRRGVRAEKAPLGLKSPDGRVFFEAEEQISPDQAVALVKSGAIAAWDSCGCGSELCEIDWFSRNESLEFAGSGPPVLRDVGKGMGELSRWQTADGSVLVLAGLDVKWVDWAIETAGPER